MKQSEADTLRGIIDLMIDSSGDGNYAQSLVAKSIKDDDTIVHQQTIIKAKNDQIDFLKSEMAKADIGHSEMADTINDLRGTKIHYEAVIEELKERLKEQEPEIEKSCDNCYHSSKGSVRCNSIGCGAYSKYDKWQPKQHKDAK